VFARTHIRLRVALVELVIQCSAARRIKVEHSESEALNFVLDTPTCDAIFRH